MLFFYQAAVILSCYSHHPAVLGNLLMAYPLYTDVNDFLEITEGLPLNSWQNLSTK